MRNEKNKKANAANKAIAKIGVRHARNAAAANAICVSNQLLFRTRELAPRESEHASRIEIKNTDENGIEALAERKSMYSAAIANSP